MSSKTVRFRARWVAGGAAALAVISLSLAGTALPAQADPVITDVSAYAVNVPSSVLAAAAAGVDIPGVTAAQYGGLLANTAKFNSGWLTTSVGQTMGGSTSATPPDRSTLSPSDSLIYGALVDTGVGAPATAASEVAVTALGAAAAVVLVPVAGFMVGATAERLSGVDVTGELCTDPTAPDGDAAQLLAQLTFSDCAQWNLAGNARDAIDSNLGTLTTGGLSCYVNNPAQCVQIVGGTSFETDPYGANSYCMQATGTGTVGFLYSLTDADPSIGVALDTGTSPAYGCYGDGPGTWVVQDGDQRPITSYCAVFSGYCAGNITTPTVTQNNPVLHYRCTMLMADGTSRAQDSSTFYASDPEIPKPELPAVPAGEVPSSMECDLIGGPTNIAVTPWVSTTTSFQSWYGDFHECNNGSCLIDLRLHGSSCLFSTANCDGWVTDPDRSADYACYDGTHLVAIAECYVYGTTFNEADRASGHAYADPSTGEITDGQTSLSDIDAIATDLLAKPWLDTSHYTATAANLRPSAASAIAAACIAQVEQQNTLLVIKVDPKDLCPLTPIYSPGSDIPAATAHDASAIADGQPWILHYESRSQKTAGGLSPGWYAPASTNCAGEYHPKGDPQYTHCDEYPFYSTVEGGRSSSLLNIWNVDNTTQGFQLAEFYSSMGCDLTASATPSEANEYLVTPDPGFPSVAICN